PHAEAPTATPYLRASGLNRWEPILRAGSIIQGPLHAFDEAEQQALEREGVQSILVVPIFARQQWWGFIAFDDCRQERQWAGGVVEALRAAAGTLGAAIERRWAEAERLQLVREQSARVEAEAAQRRQTLLAEGSHILASSLETETTLQGLANLVVPAVADWCAIDVRGTDGLVVRMAQVPHAAGEPGPPSDSVYPVARVLRSGEPLLFAELPRDVVGQLAGECDFSSGLLVPLVTRAGIAGVITCLGRPPRPPFDTRDLNLAQDLARRSSMAIDNSQLYREARTAISIRDEFLSVAAHELKTPMTSLRGYAQLLGRELERGDVPSPERAHRAAVTIQVQVDKLARLVAQLLDISRIQSGKLAIERRPTDLSQLVRDVIESARPQLERHTVVVRLTNQLLVEVDPLRLEQVMTNLLDNAIKYSPDGGQIDVVLESSPHQVELSVRDRGVGVPQEHRAHIFDRFYQAHAGGPLTSMAGMGLGLYISRQIVELHGGDIKAEFPENGGTRVIVVLPLWQAAISE
ncbi:MAG TPA: ATP-binding protein, partial [Chloroflexota bacterium]|nr:ATP-binding protein [Chloroflexota bacterium]